MKDEGFDDRSAAGDSPADQKGRARPDADAYARQLEAWDDALARGAVDELQEISGCSSQFDDQFLRDCELVAMLQSLRPDDDRPHSVSNLAGQESDTRIGDDTKGAVKGPSPRIGSWSLGRFQVSREVGRGGFGVVYEAYDPRLKRTIALKVPYLRHLRSPEVRERFTREATAVARLEHPNVVAVYEAGEVGPVSFLVAAFCDGISLQGWLREQAATLPADEAAKLMVRLADAVSHAHQRGVLHRDLKPANVLLVPVDAEDSAAAQMHGCRLGGHEYVPRVVDFGMAKTELDDASLTSDGSVFGTPSYMAPEQAGDERLKTDERTDVYGLGAILYELLTGQPPFQGDSNAEILHRARESAVVPPGQFGTVPRDLETICTRCLAKEPRDRYQSAIALRDDLERFVANEPITARRASRLEHVIRWAQRKPAIASLAAAVLVVALLGGGTTFWQWRSAVQSGRDVERAEKDSQRAEQSQKRATSRADYQQYLANISAAQAAWADYQIVLALSHLERCRPELRHWEWHHLQHLTTCRLLAWQGHAGEVDDLVVSADGQYVASVSAVDGLRVWLLDNGKEVCRWQPGARTRLALAFVDAERLAVIANEAVHVLKLPSGSVQATIPLPTLGGGDIAVGPESRRLAIATGKTLTLWDLNANKQIWSTQSDHKIDRVDFLTHTTGRMARVLGRELFTFSESRVQGWDVLKGTAEVSYEFGPGARFTMDHYRIREVFPDRIVDVSMGQTLYRSTEGNFDDALLHGYQKAATIDANRIEIWSFSGEQPRAILTGHEANVVRAAFHPDGSKLVSADQGGGLRVWSTGAGQHAQKTRIAGRLLLDTQFDPRGEQLIIAATPRVQLFDMQTRTAGRFVGEQLPEIPIKGGEFQEMLRAILPDYRVAQWGPDGTIVLGAREEIHVCDAQSGRVLKKLPGHIKNVWNIAFSPDGKYMASTCGKVTLLWDATNWVQLRSSVQGPVITFSNDSRKLFVGDLHGDIHVDEVATGELHKLVSTHHGPILTLETSPRGRYLAVGGTDHSISIWDLSTERRERILRGHTAEVYSMAWTEDEQRLFSVGKQDAIRMWVVSTGDNVLTLPAAPFCRITLSPDNQHLAVGVQDVLTSHVAIYSKGE